MSLLLTLKFKKGEGREELDTECSSDAKHGTLHLGSAARYSKAPFGEELSQGKGACQLPHPGLSHR